MNRQSVVEGRKLCERAGFIVARKADYYSPLPSEQALRKNFSRWARPSPLQGVAYDTGAMKDRLQSLKDRYYEEFVRLPSYQELCAVGFGPGYTHVDAFVLYSMIRHLQPSRYLEVGSGLSTYYCSLARQRNRREQRDTKMLCIEPFPYPKLNEIEQIELINKEVQDVPLATFESLQSGDVLFIDSSHVVRLDGDVPYLFLEVLPALKPGVYIHIHDIPFPYNIPYPPEYWTLLQHERAPRWPMFWNEAMLLQAFLAYNRSFEIVLSCPIIRHEEEAFLTQTLPIYRPISEEPNTFSSLWLRRVD